MLKKILITLSVPLLSLLVISVATPLWGVSAQPASQAARSAVATAPGTGTLQKMIVENGIVTMDLDLDRLNGISVPGQMEGRAPASPLVDGASSNLRSASQSSALHTLHFAVGVNSFFPILIFNEVFRAIEPGSMALVPVEAAPNAFGAAGASVSQATRLPLQLSASLNRLVVEKLPSGQGFDLAVRDSNTGFTFFNVEGHQYDYDSAAQSLAITNGRLLVSKEFADTLGRPSGAGAAIGIISIGAAMQPIQIDQLVNGETKSMVMPPLQHAISPETSTLVPGPDVIVGEVEDVAQMGHVGTQFNFAVGTDSCNNGDTPVDWMALPNTDHPVVPQNLYRMSGGADGTERFEQIGQSMGETYVFCIGRLRLRHV
jgi:hypothetical protein